MRYVIKHPTEGYFTHFEVSESIPILAPMEMVLHQGSPPVPKGAQIGSEEHYRPKFEAFKPGQATQFDTEDDAKNQIANTTPNHGGPQAFASCTVALSPGPGEALPTG
jgi:hypothetical protein